VRGQKPIGGNAVLFKLTAGGMTQGAMMSRCIVVRGMCHRRAHGHDVLPMGFIQVGSVDVIPIH